MPVSGAQEKKPLTRFGEFELLKAIAIIGLPAVHIIEEALEAGAVIPRPTGYAAMVFSSC